MTTSDDNNQDLQSAKHTIDKEIEALRMMERDLNGNLSKALDIMQNTSGRVIITGITPTYSGNNLTNRCRL